MTGNSAHRTLIVGIDEAGYGPVLGPLVVSAAAFNVPAAIAEESLWSVLRESVAEKVSARERRIPIMDSKKLYKRDAGIGALERSVLSVLGAGAELPESLPVLLRGVAPGLSEMLTEYPWYRDLDQSLPAVADAGSIRVATSALRHDLDQQGIGAITLRSEVLPEGHYNRLVDRIRNKAVVLLGQTLRLIQFFGAENPDVPIHFLVDKQGARDDYRRVLMNAFEGATLRVVNEGPECSTYQMRHTSADWHISFTAKGDARHLPISMASLLSKYLRELLMERFNHYWSQQVPDLKPTAGYYSDGQRFLADIAPAIRRLEVNEAMLVRSR